jgi:transmembrane sensor
MSEQHQRLDRAMAEVAVDWDAQRARRVLAGVRRQRGRRTTEQLLAVVVLIAVSVGGLAWKRAHAPAQLSLKSSDGSVAGALTAETVLRPLVDRPELVEIELASGSASFHVTKRPERHYRVRAGDVTVEVLGTTFVVDRRADGTRVAVEEGRVHVAAYGAEALLLTGQEHFFARPAPASAPIAASALEPPPLPPAVRIDPVHADRPVHAEQSVHAERPVHEEPPRAAAHADAPVTDPVSELMLSADRARVAGQPLEAARLLRSLLSAHANDERASLAAFTLGRVLLEELHAPRDAAAAFARAQTLEPDGALAEDAAAREVEAWSAAEDVERTTASARKYLEHYPSARRAAEIRRLGKLD